MRLSRYFIYLFFIICIGLAYTHQNFLIVKTHYSIKEAESQFLQLLDQNKKLMYNVTTLESPANLEAKLSMNGIDYEIPMKRTVVKRLKSEPVYRLAQVAERRNVVLEGIINFLTARAEAHPLIN